MTSETGASMNSMCSHGLPDSSSRTALLGAGIVVFAGVAARVLPGVRPPGRGTLRRGTVGIVPGTGAGVGAVPGAGTAAPVAGAPAGLASGLGIAGSAAGGTGAGSVGAPAGVA